MKFLHRHAFLSFLAIVLCSFLYIQQATAGPAPNTATTFNPHLFYRITNESLGDGRSLDSSLTAPFMGDSNNVSGQFWKLTPVGDNHYRLTNAYLGLNSSLGVSDSGNNDLVMEATSDVDTQSWLFTATGNDYYRITNQVLGNGRSLDVDNNQLSMAPTDDISRQNWHLTPLPPFPGTIFLEPDIITPSDPTFLESATYIGRGERPMFDRRVDGWITVNAYLFEATFSMGPAIEVRVNPEFASPEGAQVEVDKYLPAIGQLPATLRAEVKTIFLHRGLEPWAGGDDFILIHTDQGEQYIERGIMEETLIHELAHTALDPHHAAAQGWLDAQAADPMFISTYAQEFPDREDVAESFLVYLAVRYRQNRISQFLEDTVYGVIPNRIAYFDAQAFDMSPIVAEEAESMVYLPLITRP